MSRTTPREEPVTRLLCLRHGQSHDNARKALSSRPPGAALTDLGQAQARAALDAIWPQPVTAVYASTALRAIETGNVIAERYGLSVRQNDGLLEYEVAPAKAPSK